MPQIFDESADSVLRLVFYGAVVVAVVVLTASAVLVRANPVHEFIVRQPVPFSHKHHVGALGLDCRYCHTAVETQASAGIPSTHTCMTCHSRLWTSAGMLAPLRRSLARREPLAWTRVHDLPDYVYFNHSIHLAKGVGCQSCHGRVAEMPLMHKARPLTMGWCLSCHRDPGPHLRPASDLFDTLWRPPDDREALARRLLRAHRIRNPMQLTNCHVCHR